jgi:hypothetical protein
VRFQPENRLHQTLSKGFLSMGKGKRSYRKPFISDEKRKAAFELTDMINDGIREAKQAAGMKVKKNRKSLPGSDDADPKIVCPVCWSDDIKQKAMKGSWGVKYRCTVCDTTWMSGEKGLFDG